ncbi:MAG: hypothetical protein QXK37_00965 [Candidatus Woesearchaeota archaeon]
MAISGIGVLLGKRAFFFTFIAIVVISIFVLVFSTAVKPTGVEIQETSRAKVEVIDAYTKELKDVQLPRAITASSRAAIDSMLEYIYVNREYMTNVQTNFSELLLYGTLSGQPYPRMDSKCLKNWSDRVENLSLEVLGIETHILFDGFSIYQTEPFSLQVEADVQIKTNKSSISYNIQKRVQVNMSLIGMLEPVSLYHDYNRTIMPTNITPTGWNVSTTREFISKSQFRWNRYGEAPSFLMRLEGNLKGKSSCCGIESLLNGSVGNFNRSYVDYQYYNGTGDVCPLGIYVYNVSGITDHSIGSPGFRLDAQHIGLYGLNETETLSTC